MPSRLHNELRYGARFLFRDNFLCEQRVRDLLANERLSRGELQLKTDWLLMRSLRHSARCLPFYRSINMNFDSRSAREALVDRFPVIDRDDLLARRDVLYPYGGRARRWNIIGKTSGTSGTPLEIFRSASSVIWENAFINRHLRWSGYSPGMRRAYLRGDFVVATDCKEPPFWFYNRYNNQLVISSRHLREEFAESIINALGDFSPIVLQAYPSTAYALAQFLEHRNQKLSIPNVYTSSEPLYPHQRALIEKRLSARVMDHYGMAERVAFGAECEKGGLHINTDYSYVELVDEDNQPVNDEGYIVGTTFHNHVMPLIRYKLSDRTKWRTGTCPCGRPYPMIEPVTGKYEDTIFGSDGQVISPSVVTFAFKGLHHIKQSQIAQVANGEWEIRIVPTQGFGAEERSRLIGNIREFVDTGVRITVKEVDEIPRTSAAKYKWIVNECRANERLR